MDYLLTVYLIIQCTLYTHCCEGLLTSPDTTSSHNSPKKTDNIEKKKIEELEKGKIRVH